MSGELVLNVDKFDHSHDLRHPDEFVDLCDPHETSNFVDSPDLEYQVNRNDRCQVNDEPA